MIDPDLEKALPAKDLLGLGIYKIDPHIATKYRLLAELIAFFEKWREEALEYR